MSTSWSTCNRFKPSSSPRQSISIINLTDVRQTLAHIHAEHIYSDDHPISTILYYQSTGNIIFCKTKKLRFIFKNFNDFFRKQSEKTILLKKKAKHRTLIFNLVYKIFGLILADWTNNTFNLTYLNGNKNLKVYKFKGW